MSFVLVRRMACSATYLIASFAATTKLTEKLSTANLGQFFVIGRKKVFAHQKMAVFGGFWDEIPYLGVKFPALNPLLGRKTAAERGVLVVILRVNVEKYEGES